MADNEQVPPVDDEIPEAEKKPWVTPVLITEDISDVTKGGSQVFASPGDDTWYQS